MKSQLIFAIPNKRSCGRWTKYPLKILKTHKRREMTPSAKKKSPKVHITVDQIILLKSTDSFPKTCMHKINKKKIRTLKKKQRDKIWIVRWKTKGPIDAVSAWSVYMYVYQYEHAPPPNETIRFKS